MSLPQEPRISNAAAPAPPQPSTLNRFFGGRPLVVLFRLALLSVLVGFILKVLGLDPFDIIRSIRELFQAIWDMGYEDLSDCGAISCLAPCWSCRSGIVRLVRAPRGH
jgi:hypothetical protein